LSVENNIKAVLEMTDLPKQEQKEKLESLIAEFGLEKVRKSNGDTLSGGERRRTEIARALAVSPIFFWTSRLQGLTLSLWRIFSILLQN
jgi:lipopolysaccharide export system ATP-binding protein